MKYPAPNDLQLISLTPTKNEQWIIEKFIAAARMWAHRVIIADQGSTDGTLQAIQSAPGVEAVINDSPIFDEVHRQRLLIDKARSVSGRRVLIALDADEFLSANSMESSEWQKIYDAKPGTVLRFRWVNILPGFKRAWIPDQRKRCGFIDDGSVHSGNRIHNQRIPGGPEAPVLDLHEIVLLHFQYVSWERMRRKHRWYQVWEYLNNLKDQPLQIFRQYNHMHGSWKEHEMFDVQPKWFEGFDRAGIDFRSLTCEPITWWDKEVVELLRKHGPDHFRRLSIWDEDWRKMATLMGMTDVNLTDPRNVYEKWIHKGLEMSQNHRTNLGVRAFEKFLRSTGW